MIYTVGSCHSIDSSLMTVSICDSFLYRDMMSLHRDITAYTGMDRLNGSGGHRHYDIPQGASLLAGGWARRHRLRHHIAKAWWSNASSAWADLRRTSQGLRTQGQSEVASVGSEGSPQLYSLETRRRAARRTTAGDVHQGKVLVARQCNI